MATWISVEPESANVPHLEWVRGIQVKVFASPHDVPIAVKGEYEQDCDRFVIRLKYVDQDSSGLNRELSDDGVIHVYKGVSSGRVERIEVDVKKKKAATVELNIMVDQPSSLIEHVRDRLKELRNSQSSPASRLNYLAVSEALEQSKEMLAMA
jgi:hypothetical protein